MNTLGLLLTSAAIALILWLVLGVDDDEGD